MASLDVREFFKKWPRFYYLVATVLGPLWWSGRSAKSYLKYLAKDGKVLNVGSGPFQFNDSRVVNVDIAPYPGVAIVASAEAIPLPAGSVVGIILDNVLEHVKMPKQVVEEMARLLVPGGTIYIATPFLYPFHSSPSDYSRWTTNGLVNLLGEEFEVIEQGVRNGPFSALTAFLSHLLATLFSFGNRTLRAALFNVFMLVLLPLKIFDLVFAYWPGADEIAAILYVVARKK